MFISHALYIAFWIFAFIFSILLYYFPSLRLLFIFENMFINSTYITHLISKLYFAVISNISPQHQFIGKIPDGMTRYIGCFAPHNILPLAISHYDVHTQQINKKVVAKELLDLPLVGNILKKMGAIKSTNEDIINELRMKNPVMIYPGGVMECLLSFNTKVPFIYVKPRKGIFRIARRYKIPIIPFYTIDANRTVIGDPIPCWTWKQMKLDYIWEIKKIHKEYIGTELKIF